MKPIKILNYINDSKQYKQLLELLLGLSVFSVDLLNPSPLFESFRLNKRMQPDVLNY